MPGRVSTLMLASIITLDNAVRNRDAMGLGETMVNNSAESASRLGRALNRLEEYCEAVFFRIRWGLVPGYLVLVLSLSLLVYKTVLATIELFQDVNHLDENEVVVRVLGIVDIVLVMNLLLMVIFVGYVNFVSKIHIHKSEDKPDWLDTLTYSGLKVQMMGSILAISSVKLLRAYFSIGSVDALTYEDLKWLIVVYSVFVVALLCVAVTNRLHESEKAKDGN
jgi:uncharacterized protein (TIGR00645 family)